MKGLLKLFSATLMLVALFGCAHNYYNIPQESFQSKVRVLGVAPIFVDSASDIRHPEKDSIVALLKNQNRANERELVRMLKETNAFFAVRFVEGDADQMYADLKVHGEKRDDAGIVYNKYFFSREQVARIIHDNNLDALMLVVVSGVTHRDKVSSSNLLSYLETDYNDLIMTAQLIDAGGNVLWEFPNFRQRINSFPVFFQLQYPDFDEAAANETDRVEIRFKTVAGITRAFQKKEKDFLRRDLRVSKLYSSVFSDMVSILEPSNGLFGGGKKEKPEAGDAGK